MINTLPVADPDIVDRVSLMIGHRRDDFLQDWVRLLVVFLHLMHGIITLVAHVLLAVLAVYGREVRHLRADFAVRLITLCVDHVRQ